MPTYNYKCPKDGYFELQQSMAEHAKGKCPTCESVCKQVMLSAPALDIWAMAKAGMPGAHETVGDRMTKRHKEAGQATDYWRDDYNATNAEVAQRNQD